MPNRLSRICLAGNQSSSLYLHKTSATLQTARGNAIRCERNQLQFETKLLMSPLCLITKTNPDLLVEDFSGGSKHTGKNETVTVRTSLLEYLLPQDRSKTELLCR